MHEMDYVHGLVNVCLALIHSILRKEGSVRGEFQHSETLNIVAQLIKSQRQILGFNLKVRKAKQQATGSYLHLISKYQSCFLEFSE